MYIHQTLSDQILNISGQFHIMIGHDIQIFNKHILTFFLEIIIHTCAPTGTARYDDDDNVG